MKNLTIRRMTERGEQLYLAIAERNYGSKVRSPAMMRQPEIARYLRYCRYRHNLKRLGIQ